MKTEFYETAVGLGFYGRDKSGLSGKKDNVRKYWEDISIKLLIRSHIEKIISRKGKIRIVDLGSGSGEGIELLTHIPMDNSNNICDKDFLLTINDIEYFCGLDISPSMIEQGKINYKKHSNIDFIQSDLSKGFQLKNNPPFDLYFSSYSSLSHLSYEELLFLSEEIFSHIENYGLIIYDLFGRYSPEWPIHWNKTCHEMLPYNMAYLLPRKAWNTNKVENFNCTYWSFDEFENLINIIASKTNKKIKIQSFDRSIFVGRHMDTGIFNNSKSQYRYQVNRFFDRDFRGEIKNLKINLQFTDNYIRYLPDKVSEKINKYKDTWNIIIEFLDALINTDKNLISSIISSADISISDDLKMLEWLYENASRFPVVDFIASVLGPQVACVLRNNELSLGNGLGCGHGLFCIVEVSN